MLTDLQLRQISPKLPAAKLQLYLPQPNKVPSTQAAARAG